MSAIENGVAADSESLRILNALTKAVHPFTGQPLPDDSVYQHIKVLHALENAFRALKGEKVQLGEKPKRGEKPTQSGKPWPHHEISQLLHDFEAGMSIGQLAQRHGRTRGAIRSRLAHLGKLPPDPRWAAQDAKKREKKSAECEPLLPPKTLPPQPAVDPSRVVPDGEIPF